MTRETHTQLANFIWSICNLLRGPYKRNEYRKVILPLTVLRRFDCLLAPTKAKVLAEHAKIKTKPETVVRMDTPAGPVVARAVCPDGKCRVKQDGVVLRPDGLHYQGPGGVIVARWLMSQVPGK